MAINYRYYLCMARDHCFALSCQESKNFIPFSKATKRQFADNERVAEQPIIIDDSS
ncbi:hypothetical protein DFI02_1046 [Rhizobium sp. PP-F2F-G20b]|nr:hypothetical protein DFI02_1046 [Rhizobium sp. PP-F2F-G20b]